MVDIGLQYKYSKKFEFIFHKNRSTNNTTDVHTSLPRHNISPLQRTSVSERQPDVPFRSSQRPGVRLEFAVPQVGGVQPGVKRVRWRRGASEEQWTSLPRMGLL